MKFQIWFSIWISLEKEIGCIVHHVLNLSMFRVTRERIYLHRALWYALHLVENWENLLPQADRALSLYEGAAGTVCFLFDCSRLVLDPDGVKCYFPLYENWW